MEWFSLCPDIACLGSTKIILMWRSPVQEIPYEYGLAADVHCVFSITDNLEHEGPLLLL